MLLQWTRKIMLSASYRRMLFISIGLCFLCAIQNVAFVHRSSANEELKTSAASARKSEKFVTGISRQTQSNHEFPGSKLESIPFLTYDSQSRVRRSSRDDKIKLVIINAGEMGNFLSHIAEGRLIQVMAKEKLNITIEIMISTPRDKDSEKTVQMVKQCFPKLRQVDFHSVNEVELYFRQKQRAFFGFFGSKWRSWRDLELSCNWRKLPIHDEENVLRALHQLLRNRKRFYPHSKATISLPYLITDRMHWPDRMQWGDSSDDLKDLFEFDSERCCGVFPEPDEILFHDRGFTEELKGQSFEHELFFQEVSPNQLANILFRNLKAGDKVAIVARFPPLGHVKVLQERGIQVRYLGQSAVNDFCSILHAQAGVVATQSSTFASWAASLNKYQVPTLLYEINLEPPEESPGNLGWSNKTQGIRYVKIPKNLSRFP